jgi:hypothetical protein
MLWTSHVKKQNDALTLYPVKRALCQVAQTLCPVIFYIIIRSLIDYYALSSHRRSLTIAELIFPSLVSLGYVSIVKWKLTPNNRQNVPELLRSPYSFQFVATTTMLMGRVAQSVQRLAMGWTVRGSNPSGGRYFPHLSRRAVEPTQPPVQWVPGVSRA